MYKKYRIILKVLKMRKLRRETEWLPPECMGVVVHPNTIF